MESNTSFHHIFGHAEVPSGSWDNVWEKSAKSVLFYIPVILACYFVTLFVLQRMTDWKGLMLQRLAGQLAMYPSFFLLIISSHGGSSDAKFWNGYEGRFFESDLWVDVFANFYIAVNIAQAIGQVQTEKPPLLYQLMVHHALSITCYTSGFYFDRFRFWTAFAGCCEITNLFLVPVFASKDYFPEWRRETWFLWNSRLLWFTFVTHRLVLFPCWLGLWFYDRLKANPDIQIHYMEGIGYPLTIFGLFILSGIWFRQIDRGLKKQLIIYLEAQKEKHA